MDWRKTLATVAPAIATALGGPLAGVAVQMAGKAIGLSDGCTESDVEAAVLSGNPDVLVRLREVNAQFEKDMAALGVDLERIHAGDRDSARQMAIAQGTIIQAILSAILGFGFAYVLLSIFEGRFSIDPAMHDIAIYALGTLNTLLVQVFNFWFGSSQGSKTKSDTMAKALSK